MADLLYDLSQTPLALAISLSGWAVPFCQSIHIICIAVLFTSVLVVAMRVMGWIWRGQSVRQTAERFAPWAWVSLVLLLLTGLTLIVAEPIRELMALSFWIKMALLVIAVTISIRFLRALGRDDQLISPEVVPDGAHRRNAVITVLVWVAIIFMGRFIAYDALVWGSLSPLHS